MKKLSQTDIESATAAVASSFIFGILVGLPRLSSLLFLASMTRFDVDREKASLPFFLCYTTRIACGPLIGYLGGKFGLKNMTILGCLLSSLAVGVCFFVENIQTFTVLWGVAYGFSFGLGIALLPEILSLHFSSHLDKAVGICIGGECILAFPLTFLTKYLLENYGLSGTFLILSGVVLHSVLAAMLIHIPNQNSGRIKGPSRDCFLKYDQNDQNENSTFFSEQIVLKTNQDKCNGNELELKTNQDECNGNELEQKTNQDDCNGNELEPKTNQDECNGNEVVTTAISNEQKMYPKSSLYGFRVFLNPTFILIVFTQSSLMYLFTSTNTILIDVTSDHDVSLDDAVYVLTGFQAADAIGRFTLGFFTDRGCISRANFSSVGFFAIGLLLVSFIWIRGFVGVIIFVVGHGIFLGGLNMISASFVMQYVEKDCFSIAIPSRFLIYTPISFTQAPLIGFFRDKFQSYNGFICILIAICCVNGIASLMIPVLARHRQKRKNFSQDKKVAS